MKKKLLRIFSGLYITKIHFFLYEFFNYLPKQMKKEQRQKIWAAVPADFIINHIDLFVPVRNNSSGFSEEHAENFSILNLELI
jgi:hypothetical protein